MCHVSGTFALPFIIVSVWCLVILSISSIYRHLAISKPLHHRLIVTQRRLSFAIVFGFAMPFVVLTIHCVLKYEIEYNHEQCACRNNVEKLRLEEYFVRTTITKIIAFVFSLFSLMMITFSYVNIILVTRSQNEFIQDNRVRSFDQNDDRIKSIDRKVLRMLLATTLAFLVAWPPLFVTDLIISVGIAVPESVKFCTFWLSISSSWLQVLGLAVTSANFRRTSYGIFQHLVRTITCTVRNPVNIGGQGQPSGSST